MSTGTTSKTKDPAIDRALRRQSAATSTLSPPSNTTFDPCNSGTAWNLGKDPGFTKPGHVPDQRSVGESGERRREVQGAGPWEPATTVAPAGSTIVRSWSIPSALLRPPRADIESVTHRQHVAPLEGARSVDSMDRVAEWFE